MNRLDDFYATVVTNIAPSNASHRANGSIGCLPLSARSVRAHRVQRPTRKRAREHAIWGRPQARRPKAEHLRVGASNRIPAVGPSKFLQACAVLQDDTCMRNLSVAEYYSGHYVEAYRDIKSLLARGVLKAEPQVRRERRDGHSR